MIFFTNLVILTSFPTVFMNTEKLIVHIIKNTNQKNQTHKYLIIDIKFIGA